MVLSANGCPVLVILHLRSLLSDRQRVPHRDSDNIHRESPCAAARAPERAESKHVIPVTAPFLAAMNSGYERESRSEVEETMTVAEKADLVLTPTEVQQMQSYWDACNYLAAGMIYLRANPLLREPLKPEHIKRRLLGHWGSDPGQSFIWVHLNRLIKKLDLNVLYVSGPGHGAPATLANSYLEGYYSEIYPDRSYDERGMLRLFRAFSSPGGIGSHCTPETPGSIHEGGELGYSLSHSFGAAFDNPDLIVATVVGDGEAETGPLATSWHSNKYLNPIQDGAVLPILHLNGYKIANPTLLARIPQAELEALLTGYGYKPYFVSGDDPETMHQTMAATMERCIDEIKSIQEHARSTGDITRPRWPMIVLRSPKCVSGPKEV